MIPFLAVDLKQKDTLVCNTFKAAGRVMCEFQAPDHIRHATTTVFCKTWRPRVAKAKEIFVFLLQVRVSSGPVALLDLSSCNLVIAGCVSRSEFQSREAPQQLLRLICAWWNLQCIFSCSWRGCNCGICLWDGIAGLFCFLFPFCLPWTRLSQAEAL